MTLLDKINEAKRLLTEVDKELNQEKFMYLHPVNPKKHLEFAVYDLQGPSVLVLKDDEIYPSSPCDFAGCSAKEIYDYADTLKALLNKEI